MFHTVLRKRSDGPHICSRSNVRRPAGGVSYSSIESFQDLVLVFKMIVKLTKCVAFTDESGVNRSFKDLTEERQNIGSLIPPKLSDTALLNKVAQSHLVCR